MRSGVGWVVAGVVLAGAWVLTMGGAGAAPDPADGGVPAVDAAAVDAAAADAAAADPAAADAAAAADPEALWDAARVALDAQHDPVAAAVILRDLLDHHPDSRPAERARAALAWIEARDPVAAAELLELQGAQPREGRWLHGHRGAVDAALVAVRHAQKLDEVDALALLGAHVQDPQWGFVVQRAVAQRLFFEGRYVAAMQSADAAGDAGRRGAAARVLGWRAAVALVGLLGAGVGWLVWRRVRRARGGA